MPRLKIIAFDADDTLWHNEHLYQRAQSKFKTLLAQYVTPELIEERLFQTEMRNIQQYGYGIKSFTLSMVETAIELTDKRITGSDIQTVLEIGKEMLTSEVELIENVADIVAQLAATHTLVVITKGDLRDQEGKIERSGLASHFTHVEIVSDKRASNYAFLMKKYNVSPNQFLMVGNSLRSDILPVLELGATAVYIPHQLTWAHEHAERPVGHVRYFEIENIGQLPELVAKIEENKVSKPYWLNIDFPLGHATLHKETCSFASHRGNAKYKVWKSLGVTADGSVTPPLKTQKHLPKKSTGNTSSASVVFVSKVSLENHREIIIARRRPLSHEAIQTRDPLNFFRFIRDLQIMIYYSLSEIQTRFAELHGLTKQTGRITFADDDGNVFVLEPEHEPKKSPFDVKGIDLSITTEDILAAVRSGRERD